MIRNTQYRIQKAALPEDASIIEVIEAALDRNTFRWYIAQITAEEIVVEATAYSEELNRIGGTDRRLYSGKSAALNITPTGVGCAIGGFAGDAAPATNVLASAVDYLITNPNSVNASDFIHLDHNVVYTDGGCIDLFSRGLVDLHIPYANRIGLIIDHSESWKLDIIFNIVNAARAIHGVEIIDYVVTEQPIGSRCIKNGSGAFAGTLDRPHVLFDACERLIRRGATAIAVTSNVQDLPLDDYAQHFSGNYPNPVGGVEAIISYLITNRFHLPAAHAPLINVKQLDLERRVVDARGAGEMVSTSGLACVLLGLRRAPQISLSTQVRIAETINIHNLLAVVAPAGCLGGIPMLYAQRYGIPVIAVRENQTIFEVTRSALGLTKVIEVQNYLEAAGVLLALKRGISIESIVRPLATLHYPDSPTALPRTTLVSADNQAVPEVVQMA